jgi:hypothetical protein
MTVTVPAAPQPNAPTATLRGRIVDDREQPIAATRVSVGWFIGPPDQLRLLPLPLGAVTDADGSYEVSSVPPGEWYVQVEQRALLPGDVVGEAPDYPLTYFPGVTDARLARPVRFVPGATRTVNIIVPAIPVFELALRLTPLEQVTSRQVELFLDATDAGFPRVIPAREVEPGGIARFRRLRNGRYFVWARARSSQTILAAWQSVQVDGRSLDLVLPLLPAGRISGRVVSDDIAALSGARVVAALVDGERERDPRAPDSVEIDAAGRFAIDGLFGDRRLRLIGLPQGFELEAVRLDGRDLTTPISIAPGTTVDRIELLVARRPSSPRLVTLIERDGLAPARADP